MTQSRPVSVSEYSWFLIPDEVCCNNNSLVSVDIASSSPIA